MTKAFNPEIEKNSIITFIKSICKKTKINNFVVGVSGGIDSTTVLYLLAEAVPKESIFTVHLPYFNSDSHKVFHSITDTIAIPHENRIICEITSPVDAFVSLSKKYSASVEDIRRGNLMARVRMTILFDIAKRNSALVCGTENRTERHLGYFTRYGDSASDIETIQHLLKSQVRILAKHLKVPRFVIDAKPTAGLWKGQTDEGELGFTYDEADRFLYEYFDCGKSIDEIEKQGLQKVRQIWDRVSKNAFKQEVPYVRRQ